MQEAINYMVLLYEVPRMGMFIEMESRSMVVGGKERETGSDS